MSKEQLYETIEAYLEGKLTAEARRAFEKEMAADPQLKTEVALHQRMQQELGKSGKAKLREQLQQVAQEFPLERKRRSPILRLMPVWGAVAAAIIAAIEACTDTKIEAVVGKPSAYMAEAVLALLEKGMSNKAIARELDIGEITVKAHVSAILRKLGVENRVQAVLAGHTHKS